MPGDVPPARHLCGAFSEGGPHHARDDRRARSVHRAHRGREVDGRARDADGRPLAQLGAAFALPKKRFTQEEIEHARELRAIARKKREAELRVVEAVAVEHEIVKRRLRNGSISCEVGLSDVIEALLIED
jgi:hypothetical protein